MSLFPEYCEIWCAHGPKSVWHAAHIDDSTANSPPNPLDEDITFKNNQMDEFGISGHLDTTVDDDQDPFPSYTLAPRSLFPGETAAATEDLTKLSQMVQETARAAARSFQTQVSLDHNLQTHSQKEPMQDKNIILTYPSMAQNLSELRDKYALKELQHLQLQETLAAREATIAALRLQLQDPGDQAAQDGTVFPTIHEAVQPQENVTPAHNQMLRATRRAPPQHEDISDAPVSDTDTQTHTRTHRRHISSPTKKRRPAQRVGSTYFPTSAYATAAFTAESAAVPSAITRAHKQYDPQIVLPTHSNQSVGFADPRVRKNMIETDIWPIPNHEHPQHLQFQPQIYQETGTLQKVINTNTGDITQHINQPKVAQALIIPAATNTLTTHPSHHTSHLLQTNAPQPLPHTHLAPRQTSRLPHHNNLALDGFSTAYQPTQQLNAQQPQAFTQPQAFHQPHAYPQHTQYTLPQPYPINHTSAMPNPPIFQQSDAQRARPYENIAISKLTAKHIRYNGNCEGLDIGTYISRMVTQMPDGLTDVDKCNVLLQNIQGGNNIGDPCSGGWDHDFDSLVRFLKMTYAHCKPKFCLTTWATVKRPDAQPFYIWAANHTNLVSNTIKCWVGLTDTERYLVMKGLKRIVPPNALQPFMIGEEFNPVILAHTNFFHNPN